VSEPDPPSLLRHQVLADFTGRRRRRLAIAGRLVTTVLGLWLVVLILGGLGLQPLAGLPVIGHLGAREAAPPALPKRVQAAVDRHSTVAAPAARPVQTQLTRIPSSSHRPAVSPTFRAKRRSPVRPPAPAGRSKTTLGGELPSASPAPPTTTTSPSSTTPGQLRTETSPSSTAPGQTQTPPGQTKAEPGPPTITPGTTPATNGKTSGANPTVTIP
jgi:uncharacterized iron-regulated membrane protein